MKNNMKNYFREIIDIFDIFLSRFEDKTFALWFIKNTFKVTTVQNKGNYNAKKSTFI